MSDLYAALTPYCHRYVMQLDVGNLCDEKPGLLTQHVEQSRAKIAAMKSNANSKYTTLLNLTDDGFADSLSSGTLEFTEDDLLTMSKRCIDFWKSNPDLYRKVANQVAHQAPGLRSSELNEIFFSTMSQEEVINRAKMVARAAQHGIHATYQQHDSEEEEEPEDEEMTQAQQEERVQSLKSLFTTLSDAELRKALIQTHGNVDAAADLLLNFN